MSCIEEKGSLKDNPCSAQNAALFVDLLKNIFLFYTPSINNINIEPFDMSNTFCPHEVTLLLKIYSLEEEKTQERKS